MLTLVSMFFVLPAIISDAHVGLKWIVIHRGQAITLAFWAKRFAAPDPGQLCGRDPGAVHLAGFARLMRSASAGAPKRPRHFAVPWLLDALIAAPDPA